MSCDYLNSTQCTANGTALETESHSPQLVNILHIPEEEEDEAEEGNV